MFREGVGTPDPSEVDSPVEAQIEQPAFDSSRGLEGIFGALELMNQSNESLIGSSRSYTVAELAQMVMRAIQEANTIRKAQDPFLAEAVKTGDFSRFTAYDQMPAIQALTRTGGLRQSVIESLQNTPRRLYDDTPLSGATIEAYNRLTSPDSSSAAEAPAS